MHAVQNNLFHNTYLLNICTVLTVNHKRQGCCSRLVQIDFLSEKLRFKETKQGKNRFTPFVTQAHHIVIYSIVCVYIYLCSIYIYIVYVVYTIYTTHIYYTMYTIYRVYRLD